MTIRRVPTDFRVEEHADATFRESMRPAADSRTLHAIYRLEKTSLSTPEATARLAKALAIKPGDVAHAGLKDKHAFTIQHISAKARDIASADRFASEIIAPAIRASLIGWGSEPVDASIIDSNHFEIVVRGLTREACDRMTRHAAALATPDASTLLVTNYFGEQRFGSARHGQGFAAAHLVRGDFESALKLLIATPARKDTGARRAFTRAAATHWGQWQSLLAAAPPSPHRRAIEVLASGGSFAEAFAALPMIDQRMCLDAFQSWLWNHAAAELLRQSLATDPGATIEVTTDHGPLVFARADAMPSDLTQLVTPLPRKGAPINATMNADWVRALAVILSRESLSLDQLDLPSLRRPRFDTGDRPLFMRTADFSLSAPVPDEFAKGRIARTARFSLPSGCYATVVLRALGH
ncbi:MAG: tRNA pseudouridine(13) synthase TruD [Phycisphaerales bacterium]|nr:tRNA pseudouridine(13) synthase TruD [Phycisphaerales bacterium]